MIDDAFNGRSLGFLNRLATLRPDDMLEDFYAWAETLLFEAVLSLLIIAGILSMLALYERFARGRAATPMRHLRYFDGSVFLAGIAVSFAMVLWLSDTYYGYDIGLFFEWRDHIDRFGRELYLACESCNYPILGTLFSAGVLQLSWAIFPTLDADAHAQLLRLFLAVVDAANVVLVFLILRALRVRRSLLWAGVIGLLPSSWIGGAVWGQIDGVSQFLLLAFLLLQLSFGLNYEKARSSLSLVVGYIAGSSVLIASLLLTKQLAVFTVPILVLLVLATLYFSAAKRFILSSAVFLVLVPILILASDLVLALPDGYFSHLQYIFFGGGSEHVNVISGNGFNIWMFLGRRMSSPSTTPFLASLTPRDTGAFLFFAYELGILVVTALWARRGRLTWPGADTYPDLFMAFVFLLALTQLAFNVLLTGTHERYLYHFYPLMLIAFVGLRQRHAAISNLMLAAILGGALIYGRFVWGILSTDAVEWPHHLVAVVHVLLLIYLSMIFVRLAMSSAARPSSGGSAWRSAEETGQTGSS